MQSTITTCVRVNGELEFQEDGNLLIPCEFLKRISYKNGMKLDEPELASVPCQIILRSNDEDTSEQNLAEGNWIFVSGDFHPSNGEVTIFANVCPFTGHCVKVVDKPFKVNQVTCFGQIRKKDPYVNDAKTVCSFSLGITRKKGETYWVDCVAFNRGAQTLGQYLKPSAQLAINAELDICVFEKQDGVEMNKIQLQINGFSFVRSNYSSYANEAKAKPASKPTSVDYNDIPF